jgi:glycogen operon protein
MKTWPGQPYPLGATWDGRGANFALFSENATAVDLCLFSSDNPNRQTDCIRMTERTNLVWHVYLPDARPGLLYAFRVHGPSEIPNGHRFNSAKLLLDPYAKAIEGDVDWNDSLFGYIAGDPNEDLSFDGRDSSKYIPKCAVIDTKFDWKDDAPLRTP